MFLRETGNDIDSQEASCASRRATIRSFHQMLGYELSYRRSQEATFSHPLLVSKVLLGRRRSSID